MTEMTAFERQVAGEMVGRAGPIRPVDDLEILESVIAANRQKGRGFTMFSALKLIAASVILALFGGFLIAGTLTAPRIDDAMPAAMPESPEAEAVVGILFELAVPRWALPDDPTALEAGGWTLVAGTDVSSMPPASQANESMRNRAFMVTSGAFLIEPTTDALLWRAPGAQPQIAPAAEPVTLQAGEAIYLPAVRADEIDPERYLRIANPGSEDATGVTFHVHEGSTGAPFGGFPSGLRWKTWFGDLVGLGPITTDWTTADEALFRLTRHRVDAGSLIDSVESTTVPATTIYLMESGALEQIVSGPGGEFGSVWRPRTQYSFQAAENLEQTLTAAGDEPTSFLELVAIPRASTSE